MSAHIHTHMLMRRKYVSAVQDTQVVKQRAHQISYNYKFAYPKDDFYH